MATPYTIDITARTRRGEIVNRHLTSSDVTTEYYLDANANSAIVLSSDDCKIVDMLFSASPATTKTATITINGGAVDRIITGAANLTTSIIKQVNERNPIILRGGSTITFKQV